MASSQQSNKRRSTPSPRRLHSGVHVEAVPSKAGLRLSDWQWPVLELLTKIVEQFPGRIKTKTDSDEYQTHEHFKRTLIYYENMT